MLIGVDLVTMGNNLDTNLNFLIVDLKADPLFVCKIMDFFLRWDVIEKLTSVSFSIDTLLRSKNFAFEGEEMLLKKGEIVETK